jgi:hypothetical protein
MGVKLCLSPRQREIVENRVLRILVPKREEVTESWRKLHNLEFHDLQVHKGEMTMHTKF